MNYVQEQLITHIKIALRKLQRRPFDEIGKKEKTEKLSKFAQIYSIFFHKNNSEVTSTK